MPVGLFYPGKEGQTESKSLAGSGRSLAGYVPARQSVGNRRRLDREGFDDVASGEGPDEWVG
jgi:hypothetical protein